MSWQPIFHLIWPDGWSESTERTPGRFGVASISARAAELVAEIERFDGANIRVSCNAPSSFRGTNSTFREPKTSAERAMGNEEPGASVWFSRLGKEFAIACDKFESIQANLRALCLTVEAIRGIDRWGASEILDRAMQGFAELPPPSRSLERNWWEVLGVSSLASLDVCEQSYRSLAKKRHPDTGGTTEAFQELQSAIELARTAWACV